jgi:tRNA threonylcarbamoyl adenosine modification protein YeaZ
VLIVVVDSATPAVTAALASVTDPNPSLVTGSAASSPSASSPSSSSPGGSGVGTAGLGVEVLAEAVTVDARAHGELLAPAIASVLREGGASPRDLDAIVAGLGPGPFTGLRVGLVTAAALADELNIPAYGVCTLDALGWAAGPGRVLVATDARRKEIYWAVYQDGVRLTEPSVGKPADLALPDGVGAAIGDGALRYADVLGLPVRPEPRYPPAVGLAALAATPVRTRMSPQPLTPLYLRRPDAVLPGARKPALP